MPWDTDLPFWDAAVKAGQGKLDRLLHDTVPRKLCRPLGHRSRELKQHVNGCPAHAGFCSRFRSSQNFSIAVFSGSTSATNVLSPA
jgi:hypothetical protein